MSIAELVGLYNSIHSLVLSLFVGWYMISLITSEVNGSVSAELMVGTTENIKSSTIPHLRYLFCVFIVFSPRLFLVEGGEGFEPS